MRRSWGLGEMTHWGIYFLHMYENLNLDPQNSRKPAYNPSVPIIMRTDPGIRASIEAHRPASLV